MTLEVQVWQEGWTASEASKGQGHWVPTRRRPTVEEQRVSAEAKTNGNGGQFWEENGELHAKSHAGAGARRLRIVERLR